MDKTARRFASWVLSTHVLLLGLLVVIVAFATWEVYGVARQQALDQVRIRQELLATQAARGLGFFYRNLQDNLELLARSDTPDTLAPRVWEQLRGRVTHLFSIDAAGNVKSVWRDEEKVDLSQIVQQAGPWLHPLAKPTISDSMSVGGMNATLVAVPAWTQTHAPPGRAWVAIVPISVIEARFLNDFNQPDKMGALLMDDQQHVLSAPDRALVGVVMSDPSVDPRVRAVADESIRAGQRTTREFLSVASVHNVRVPPAMVTMQPVELPDKQRWWLAVSSSLADVDYAVAKFFRRALIGAGVIIIAMTIILVSTSTTMIRGRMRLERVQHELLTRELGQARDIQLRWLPEQQEKSVSIDIAAVNRPASHVSGDFYNWFEMPGGKVCIVIGDVTGHGLAAAFLMATTQLLVRAIIERVPDPGACLRETNRLLCQHVFSGQFVTLLVGILDPQNNTIELATAGHPAPVIAAGEAFTALAVEPDLVLAIDKDVAYRTQHFDLPEGASMLLYTDGVTDVQNPSDERMGDDWLTRSAYGKFHRAQDVVDTVLDAIDAFRNGREPADDLTLVAIQLQKQPAATPAAALTPQASGIK